MVESVGIILEAFRIMLDESTRLFCLMDRK